MYNLCFCISDPSCGLSRDLRPTIALPGAVGVVPFHLWENSVGRLVTGQTILRLEGISQHQQLTLARAPLHICCNGIPWPQWRWISQLQIARSHTSTSVYIRVVSSHYILLPTTASSAHTLCIFALNLYPSNNNLHKSSTKTWHRSSANTSLLSRCSAARASRPTGPLSATESREGPTVQTDKTP